MEEYLVNLITKENKEGPQEGDYIGEDGLLYCGKCHTKRQTVINLSTRDMTVPCLCRCRTEKRNDEERAAKEREDAERIERNRERWLPDSKMREWTFANDDGTNPKMKALRKYAENFEKYRESGKGLLLFGGCGTGKTFAAACIANALIDKGYTVMMTDFSRIATTAQGMWEGRQEYYDSFNKYALLILDDFAAERKTEYMGEQVYKIINARYTANLPLIVTTNLTGEDMKNCPEITYQRAISRLREMCAPVLFDGEDRRKDKMRENYKTMLADLGLEG